MKCTKLALFVAVRDVSSPTMARMWNARCARGEERLRWMTPRIANGWKTIMEIKARERSSRSCPVLGVRVVRC